MSLTKGTNSYVTASEAEKYFEMRLDATAWVSANSDRQEQALVTATSILDSQKWTGYVADYSQPLAFPRVGVYFDDRLGSNVVMSDIPARIAKATCEQALHLLNNPGLQDDNGTVGSLSVSSISLTTVFAASLIPAVVNNLIKPMLANRGSNSWWKAN